MKQRPELALAVDNVQPLRMRTRLSFLVLWLAVVSARRLRGADADGFTPLFNGRDLTGWVNVNCAPETFTVRDGMIHCDGIPTGALRTERQYENFILELEWRHLVPGGNAGVFVWAGPLPAVGQPFLRAIEVQVLDHGYGKSDWFTTHGDVFPIHGSTMKPFSPSRGDRSFPNESRSLGAPEWNYYRIVATNGVLRLSVNGQEVSGGSDCRWRRGYLALESEGGQVDWRHLRIQEFPSTGATGADSAPDAQPWRSLYDGRSLRGWVLPVASPGVWTNADWTLHSAATTARDAILWSNELGDESEAFFDWRWEKAPAQRMPPLAVRIPGRPEPITLAALPGVRLDGWNRLHLRRRNGGLELELNGQPAGRQDLPPGPWTLGLRPDAVPIQFASVFVQGR